jgi:hypothetical protein
MWPTDNSSQQSVNTPDGFLLALLARFLGRFGG